jgi:hypothetical protein
VPHFEVPLRHLRVLCVSAVNVFEAITHRRDAEVAEIPQSKTEIRAPLSEVLLLGRRKKSKPAFSESRL